MGSEKCIKDSIDDIYYREDEGEENGTEGLTDSEDEEEEEKELECKVCLEDEHAVM